MAAGAYKGLTIRIGADTTKLSSALRGANSVIYKTQNELKKLTKAAKLDPGNNKVYSLQMGAVANEATAAAKKMDLLKKSMAEIRDTQASGENATIGMIADDTKNAALEAENAKERYNSLSAEIERVSDDLESLTGIDASEAIRSSSEDWEKAKAAMLDWAKANEDNMKAVEEWEDANHTSLDSAINDIEHLRDTWQEASAQYDDKKLVESLHNAEVEAAATEAQVKSLGHEMANLKTSSDFARSFSDLDSRIALVSAATETATDRFTRLDQAAKINPLSIGTAVDRTKALKEATEAARAKADLLKEKIQSYKGEGIDKLAKSMGNVALEVEHTKEAYAKSESEVARLKGELDNAKAAYQHLIDVGHSDNMAEDINKAADECDKLEQELREAEAARDQALKNYDTAQQCSELQELETQARETKAEIKELGKIDLSGLTNIGSAAVIAAQQVGQLASQAGRKVIDSSNEIDASYRNLRKTFDATEGDYQKLYDAAMQYSQTHVTSADNMLEMESIAAQLGVHMDKLADGSTAGADGIQRFAEAAANLDVATDIDADTIALEMGQIMNIMSDLNTQNIDRFGDSLVRLGNNMPTQESNIMQIAQRLSAVGNVAGFTTPELLGISAAIASTGQKSEAAATGISTLITKISAAVDDFDKGGDSLDKYAEVAGVSAEEFAKSWREKPVDALQDLITKLGESETLFSDLADMDVNSVRQTQTLASLSQTVDKMGDAIRMADDAFVGLDDEFGKAGDAANEANKKAEGFSGTLSKLENSGQVLAATLGDAMVPYMEFLADKLNWLTGIVNSWSEDTRSKVVLAAGGFAAFTTAWPIISTFASSVSTVVGGLAGLFVSGAGKVIAGVQDAGAAISLFASGDVANLGDALGTATTKTGLLSTAISFLATPLGVVVGSVAILAAALGYDYVTKTMKAKKSAEDFQAALDGINDVSEGLGKSIYTAGDAVLDYADKWSTVRHNMEEYHDELMDHINAAKDARAEMEETTGALDKYQSVIGDAIGKGKDYTGNIGELQYAIDKLNDATGSSWTLQDILTGKYEDETGAIKSTKDAVEDLIAAKKREAQISGIESAMSEIESAKALNKMNRKNAAADYRDWVNMKWESGSKDLNPTTASMNKREYTEWLKQNDDKTQELLFDVQKLRRESLELDETYDDLSNTLGNVVEEGSYLESSNYGVRESMIRTNDAMEDALATYMGFTTDEKMEKGVKRIAEGIRDAGVGATEFAEMSSEAFARLAEESGGDVDLLIDKIAEYNRQQLEEKYGIVKWGDDGQWFIDAEGKRHDWNGNEWAVQETSVEVEGTEEANAEIDEVQANAEEGAELDVTTNDEELDETQSKIDSQTDEEKEVTFTADSGEVDEAYEKVSSLENKEVQVTFTVDDGGIAEAKSALDELDNKEIKVSINADTSGADAITNALAGLDGKPVDVKINADTSGAQQITDALAGLSGKPIDVKINADTSGAQQVAGAINSIPDYKTSTIAVNADTGAVSVINGMLASVPTLTTATVKATTSGVDAATGRILSLNKASNAMKSQSKKYTASGNAATSSSPASNINSLNSAASNMSSKSATYAAYGNAASGAAASNIWNLINAVRNMQSKSITLTTIEKTVKSSATGAYIPPNKIPKHAAGIFTKATLTNIGWVGESGAELYSGNSLVPLTNRKYSMPYIDDISDAVAKKLGAQGTVYNVSIDGARVNDDEEIQAAILSLFDVLQRKGAMNRG